VETGETKRNGMVDVSSATRLTGWLAGWLAGWLVRLAAGWLVRLTGSTGDRLACIYPAAVKPTRHYLYV